MPSLLINTTEALGGPDLPQCDSRSLRLTRYAAPELREKPRQVYLAKVVSSPSNDVSVKSWQHWLDSITSSTGTILHARLEARLLINMAGSVMENAGLNLDRYGIAFIPGSAVKACARRTALATLRQWCETGVKPTASDEDALASAADPFSSPADLLLAIVRIFGCSDLEWQDFNPTTNDGNDLAWACANQWPTLRDSARNAINLTGENPDETAPCRRGSVAFLPSYPSKRPLIDLELDVLTSHHPEYYGSKLTTATDTENPIPVYFPSAAASAEYTFVVLPVGQPATALIGYARTWLSAGLTVLGLGAKTAAGYGVFKDISAEVNARTAKIRAAAQAAAAEAASKAKAAQELADRKAREANRAAMTPEQKADAELADRAADWGWMKAYLTKFTQLAPADQAALLRWFIGAGRERWLNEIKPESAKGKKPWSQIIGAIHLAKKTHKIDLP
jgi:CRISPR-associated protein Cmr6